MHCMLCLLTLWTLVFVAFTQYCVQSNGTHVEGVESVLCIQGPPIPLGGKACCSCQSCGFSGSPIQGGSFVNFLELVKYKGHCRQDAHPIPSS